MLAAMLSIGLTLLLAAVVTYGGSQWKATSRRSRTAATLIVGIVVLLPVAFNFAAPEILAFLTKGYEGSVGESFHLSRGDRIEASWTNFESHPFFGIGFGVPSDFSDVKTLELDPILGLPITASVEKGVLVVGMLEENGIIGSIVLMSLCFFLIRPAFSLEHPHMIALILACLFVNSGEAILFSMGGVGSLNWMMIALARMNRTEI